MRLARYCVPLLAIAPVIGGSLFSHAQFSGDNWRNSSSLTEIKWDVYTFRFRPGSQMAQVLDASGAMIGTILPMNGVLQIVPIITGADAEKLKAAFQSWKEQGGEKQLNGNGERPRPSRLATPYARPGVSPAAPTPNPPLPPKDGTGIGALTPTVSTPVNGENGHRFLSAEDLDQFENGTVRLDLAAIRANLDTLKQKSVMQYFIALNNCHDSSVQRALQNELDYPQLADFYRVKAPDILSGLPDTAGLLMFRGNTKGSFIWGHSVDGYDPTLKTLTLGEYDLNRGVFPIFVSDRSKTLTVAGTQQVAADRSSLQKSCPTAYSTIMRAEGNAGLPANYSVTVTPMTFSELPMSEADARRYIESVSSGQRGVVLGVDLHLKPNAQRSASQELAYDGTVARIRVLKNSSFEQVGILYDDHSLPPMKIKIVPSAITTMKSTREFNEEVISVAYVSLAADACGWPITPEQKANLKRYISDVNDYGKFNDKASLNGVMGGMRNSINDPSRHFCESRTERQDFDRRSATIWPKGVIGAPAP